MRGAEPLYEGLLASFEMQPMACLQARDSVAAVSCALLIITCRGLEYTDQRIAAALVVPFTYMAEPVPMPIPSALLV